MRVLPMSLPEPAVAAARRPNLRISSQVVATEEVRFYAFVDPVRREKEGLNPFLYQKCHLVALGPSLFLLMVPVPARRDRCAGKQINEAT